MIDLEFVHANSKCYLKTSIIVIIGEQSSRYPLHCFSDCTRHGHCNVPETGNIGETTNKIKKRGERSILTVPETVISGTIH